MAGTAGDSGEHEFMSLQVNGRRERGGRGPSNTVQLWTKTVTPEPTFPQNRPSCQVLVETQKQSYGPFSPSKNHRHLTLGTRAKFLGETEALWALRLTSIGASLLCLRL